MCYTVKLVFGKKRKISAEKCFMVLHILKRFCLNNVVLPYVPIFQIACLLLHKA